MVVHQVHPFAIGNLKVAAMLMRLVPTQGEATETEPDTSNKQTIASVQRIQPFMAQQSNESHLINSMNSLAAVTSAAIDTPNLIHLRF